MIAKYNYEIDNNSLINTFNRLTNQCYKILCYKEEDKDWQKPLETVILELIGLQRLINKDTLLVLISKLESLFTLVEDDSFLKFRRTIFESLGILDEVKKDARFY